MAEVMLWEVLLWGVTALAVLAGLVAAVVQLRQNDDGRD
jgi:hypothetical protein